MVISIFLAFPAFRIRSIFPKRNKLRFLAGAGIIIYNAWTFLKILLGMINYANYYNSSFFEFISYRTDMQVRLVSLLFYILIGILICALFNLHSLLPTTHSSFLRIKGFAHFPLTRFEHLHKVNKIQLQINFTIFHITSPSFQNDLILRAINNLICQCITFQIKLPLSYNNHIERRPI